MSVPSDPSDCVAPRVGVVAVQGDFAEHEAALHRFGIETRQVRVPADLEGLEGLVFPGGESTTMLKLLDLQELTDPLLERIRSGTPTLATCAGLILLAAEVTDPAQRSFGILDVAVARNGYGRQIHSGTIALTCSPDIDAPTDPTGVFIRAPRVTRVGPGVEVLARRDEDPVLLRRDRVLAACFHPELCDRHFVTALFVQSLTVAPAEA